MEEIIFYVQGSAKEPYKVTFQRIINRLSAYCTCPAGDNGQCCKHRLKILAGIPDGIASNNPADVGVIASWLPGTDVENALNELMDAEAQFESAKRKVIFAKKRLAQAFRD